MNAGTLEIQLAADVARLRADMNNALGIVQRTARGFDDGRRRCATPWAASVVA